MNRNILHRGGRSTILRSFPPTNTILNISSTCSSIRLPLNNWFTTATPQNISVPPSSSSPFVSTSSSASTSNTASSTSLSSSVSFSASSASSSSGTFTNPAKSINNNSSLSPIQQQQQQQRYRITDGYIRNQHTKQRKEIIDEMLRVDQAGEVGAVQIYAGQMWVLKGTPIEETLRVSIEN